MSTRLRKARKSAGIPFTPKPDKVPTPVEERAWFLQLVQGAPGTKFTGRPMPRSAKKRAAALNSRGITAPEAA
jgi:hypothetical protein